MSITTVSSREFNQDASKAKLAAFGGPVIITDRGRPAHVLLTFADYKTLTAQRKKISNLLAMSGVVELPLPAMRDVAVATDLS